MVEYCGRFDVSRFDTLPDGIFDCISTTNIPTAITVIDTQTNIGATSFSTTNRSSVSDSETNSQTSSSSKRNKSSVSDSGGYGSSVSDSE